jgi:hypothetical protein
VVTRRLQIAFGLVIALVGLLYASVPASAHEIIGCPAQTADPPGEPRPNASSQFSDACLVAQFAVASLPILLYNDCSWRSFVALAWPAIDGRHGVPDSAPMLGRAAGCRVFETLKSEWELFEKGGADRNGGNEYGGSIRCDVPSRAFSDIGLAASLKRDSIIHSGRWSHSNTRILPGKTISS